MHGFDDGAHVFLNGDSNSWQLPYSSPSKTHKAKKSILKGKTLWRKPQKVTIQGTGREDKDKDDTSQSNKREIEDRYQKQSIEEEDKGESPAESEQSSNKSNRCEKG